jgi:hypothetical protein
MTSTVSPLRNGLKHGATCVPLIIVTKKLPRLWRIRAQTGLCSLTLRSAGFFRQVSISAFCTERVHLERVRVHNNELVLIVLELSEWFVAAYRILNPMFIKIFEELCIFIYVNYLQYVPTHKYESQILLLKNLCGVTTLIIQHSTLYIRHIYSVDKFTRCKCCRGHDNVSCPNILRATSTKAKECSRSWYSRTCSLNDANKRTLLFLSGMRANSFKATIRITTDDDHPSRGEQLLRIHEISDATCLAIS